MPDSNPPPPAILGRYRILRRLGAGGMAEVFLAKALGAEGLEKILVVKRVLPSYSSSPRFISMFVDEAKVAMRLNHPNIVQVYAFEQVKDEFLLAMEFVDGLDLGRMVSAARRKERALPHALSALLTMEVAKGLDYAHNRRDESGAPMEIVHRDVSPQNVLVSYDGQVKIADFGIARARMVSEETGVIKGKFAYMSPEQARGQKVDRRSDVYSLGVLLAELLMNRAMYPGAQAMEVLEQVREGRLTYPRDVDPTVPFGLDRIVRRATAADPELRLQSCRSLAGELSRWLHEQEELHDAGELERFLAEIAPREVTSVEGRRRLSDQPPILTAPGGLGRELRERRNVVVVATRFHLGEKEDAHASEPELKRVVRVLSDIAFKYDARVEWPEDGSRSRAQFVLGLGRVSVDDPLHATHLALDIDEALEGLRADAVTPLGASLGISRGMVALSRTPGRVRYEALGLVFEVAGQLAEAARDGEVLVTGEIYRLARRVFAFDEGVRQVSVLTGTSPSHSGTETRSIRTYRLRGARTSEERSREARTLVSEVGLFGRADAIEALVDAHNEAVSSRRSAFLAVVGELGIGKTALVAAALSRLSPEPRLLRVECAFGASDVPFAAVAETVRVALGITDEGPVESIRQQLHSALGRMFKVQDRKRRIEAALETILVPGKGTPEPVGESSLALGRALRDVLGALARSGPTVLWIDGIQFADAPSLALLQKLMAQSYESALVVILCTRADPSDQADNEAVAPHRAVVRNLPTIRLAELGEDDRRALIAARLGTARIPNDVYAAIVHRAGGNPFFLLELIEALLERDVIRVEGEGEERRVTRRAGASFALPTTLEDVIAARIAELPESERRALMWTAVAGPGLREPELSKIAGVDLAPALEQLTRRGLLGERAGGFLVFENAVVRHVASEAIDGPDQVRMHRRVATYFSSLDVPPPAGRIARHRELAGDLEGAARAWIEAGQAAAHSKRDALRFWKRALQLLPENAPERFEVHTQREEILRLLGRRAEQKLELEAMRRQAELAQDPRMLSIALARLARHDIDGARTSGTSALLRRALDCAIDARDKSAEVEALRLHGLLHRERGDTQGALEAFDRALLRAGFDADQLGARALTLVQKSVLLWRSGHIDEALESSSEAVVIFRRLGDKGHEAYALNALGIALAGAGAFEDAIVAIRSSIVLDREVGDRIHLGRKVSNIGQIYADLGDTERAFEFLERALEIYESLDDVPGRTDALLSIAQVRIEQTGDLDEAGESLDRARQLAERIDDPYELSRERLIRASLYLHQERPSAALSAAREAVEYARAGSTLAHELLGNALRAKLAAEQGRVEEARRFADDVFEQLRADHTVERSDRIYFQVASALEQLGDRERARAARKEARRRVDRMLEQIRDPALQSRFLAIPYVRALRESAVTH